MRQFVFGYGSLARDYAPGTRVASGTRAGEGFVATLTGHARHWSVAMDNRVDLPGYKFYLAPDGSRPDVYVCFLDVSPADDTVTGYCLPVDDARLTMLDARERNYERVDVTDLVAEAGSAPVWAYVGTESARQRAATGCRAGIAVIEAAYLDAVRAGFRALGEDVLAACAASLEPRDLPVRELRRCELP